MPVPPFISRVLILLCGASLLTACSCLTGQRQRPPQPDGPATPAPRPQPAVPSNPESYKGKSAALYHFNRGRWHRAVFLQPDGKFPPDREPLEGILLSESQKQELMKALGKAKESNATWSFLPEYAFVLYDHKTLVKCIEICVVCAQARIVLPGQSNSTILDVDMTDIHRLSLIHGPLTEH